MGDSETETSLPQGEDHLLCQAIHAPNRLTNSHIKTDMVRSSSYETHSVASEMTLARSRDIGEDNVPSQVHLDWWLDEKNVLQGQPLHPLAHDLQLFTDTSNKGWGVHLKDYTARGVWSTTESQLHIKQLF